ITLELCPTSNIHTKAVADLQELKHIMQTFWDRKVKFTINTDSLPSGERLRLLDALYEMALADGPLQRSEREALKRMAEGLDVPDAKVQALAELHLGDATAHYQTLGLPPDATDAEVKSAYRKLAARFHPDKAAHLAPKAAEQAARRFQAARDAYEEIRRLRGL
ncbi:DnaJ domain-containing protein, partial [Corallococcus sp. CA041A]|uniref:DnaJ domain-containing protein n=1 Tax=Corallococcus sp. CA041A TaxID=2316727 RepID=UPI001F450F45